MKLARSQRDNPLSRLNTALLAKRITAWYRENKRILPWRESQDPYRIWISEIMLQQTMVAAVVPYYEKFMRSFPNVESLAKARLEEVLEHWSGLGYYSRARNLHKAALILSKNGFPQTAAELEELPGLGPYTSRALASLAFNEKVGVLDGNVIRVLCRVAGAPVQHWKPAGREVLQQTADALAQHENPSDLNQALMELGATVCTTHNPACLLCPWQASCVARKQNLIETLPLKKPRKDSEIWFWQPHVKIEKNRVALVQNTDLPFLRGQWVFPGKIQQLKKRPEKFDLRHGITHHDIYIQILKSPKKLSAQEKLKWCQVREISSLNPSILLKKILGFVAV